MDSHMAGDTGSLGREWFLRRALLRPWELRVLVTGHFDRKHLPGSAETTAAEMQDSREPFLRTREMD